MKPIYPDLKILARFVKACCSRFCGTVHPFLSHSLVEIGIPSSVDAFSSLEIRTYPFSVSTAFGYCDLSRSSQSTIPDSVPIFCSEGFSSFSFFFSGFFEAILFTFSFLTFFLPSLFKVRFSFLISLTIRAVPDWNSVMILVWISSDKSSFVLSTGAEGTAEYLTNSLELKRKETQH